MKNKVINLSLIFLLSFAFFSCNIAKQQISRQIAGRWLSNSISDFSNFTYGWGSSFSSSRRIAYDFHPDSNYLRLVGKEKKDTFSGSYSIYFVDTTQVNSMNCSYWSYNCYSSTTTQSSPSIILERGRFTVDINKFEIILSGGNSYYSDWGSLISNLNLGSQRSILYKSLSDDTVTLFDDVIKNNYTANNFGNYRGMHFTKQGSYSSD